MASIDRVEPPPPLRQDHDRRRAAVSSTEAARRMQRSRFWVAEQVKAGQLDGYGIPSAQRTRWFVYVDAIDSGEGIPPTLRSASSPTATTSLLNRLYQAIAQMRRAQQREREAADEGYRVALGALTRWNQDVVELADDRDSEQPIGALREELLHTHHDRDLGRASVDRLVLELEDAVAVLAAQLNE